MLLAGDILQVVQDRRFVSFMYSYPNYIPLPAAAVRRMLALLEPYPFERVYGAWFGAVVRAAPRKRCAARPSATSARSRPIDSPPRSLRSRSWVRGSIQNKLIPAERPSVSGRLPRPSVAPSLFLAVRTAFVMDRKLAAILAADVVGYSALMEADEAGTHERLKAGRKELFEPEIARHHGRLFKVMGDGMLAEFGSVVDAVECAVALQRGLAERNAAMPEDQRIQVRIGINLGELIVEGEDRYGEGVNIATRLEQLAEPGGIYVSGKVAKEVEKRLAFGFEPMGKQKVKNIAEPVSVFRIELDGTPARRLGPLPSQRAWPWAAAIAAVVLVIAGAWFASRPPAPEAVVAPDPVVADARPSLVVLPFANLSDDKEQGYLADGITEDLTTELARVPGLFVFSRNAAFTYKGKAVPPAQIAKELGVRYILEGSTRRAGEEMRINAQLIDTRTGGHLWAERFDGAWVEVFALQDKVVASVAGTLKLKLVPSSAEEAGGTNNVAAYEAWLRGWDLRERNSVDDFVKAAGYFKQALVLDPNFGAADAALARSIGMPTKSGRGRSASSPGKRPTPNFSNIWKPPPSIPRPTITACLPSCCYGSRNPMRRSQPCKRRSPSIRASPGSTSP